MVEDTESREFGDLVSNFLSTMSREHRYGQVILLELLELMQMTFLQESSAGIQWQYIFKK